jgi:anti-anti-sigma regulatory factor
VCPRRIAVDAAPGQKAGNPARYWGRFGPAGFDARAVKRGTAVAQWTFKEMIRSEFGGDERSLHLYLVGSLNADTAAVLCEEYRERRVPVLRECVVDLTGVDDIDGAGLDGIRELHHATNARHVDLVVVCTGSPVEYFIRTGLKRLGVRVRAPVESK